MSKVKKVLAIEISFCYFSFPISFKQ